MLYIIIALLAIVVAKQWLTICREREAMHKLFVHEALVGKLMHLHVLTFWVFFASLSDVQLTEGS